MKNEGVGSACLRCDVFFESISATGKSLDCVDVDTNLELSSSGSDISDAV